MLSRQFITWVILTSLHLSGSVLAFTNFPLTEYTWEDQHATNQPITQLFNAIQERCAAAFVEPLKYVEDVLIDRRYVNDPGVVATLYYWPDFPGWEFGDGAVFAGPAGGAYLVTIPPYYDHEWVTANSAVYNEDLDGWVLTFECVPPSRYIEDVYTTITNSFGPFEYDLDGINRTGVAQVTRPLLNAMWDKIDELCTKFVYPGDPTNTWVEWFDGAMSVDYKALRVGNPTYDQWTVAPYLPRVTLDYALARREIEVTPEPTANRWGIINSNTAQKLPVTPGDNYWSSTVLFASAIYNQASNSWKGPNDLVAPAGGGSDGLGGRFGINYFFYSGTNATAYLRYDGKQPTPPAASVHLTGYQAVIAVSNEFVTNVTWNGSWIDGANLSCEVTTNTTIYLDGRAADETIAYGEHSTSMWTKVSTMEVSGGSFTNGDTYSLVWDIDHWMPVDYRLYAEELNRMYYVLCDMRYSVMYEQTRNGAGPRVAAQAQPHLSVYSVTRSTDMVSSTFGGSVYEQKPYAGIGTASGEVDLGSEQPDTVVGWPFTGTPSNWPHSWDGDVISVTRPPDLAAAMSEIGGLARASYNSNVASNSLYLPYAISFRGFGWGLTPIAIPYQTDPVSPVPTVYSGFYQQTYASADLVLSCTNMPGTNWTGAVYLGDYYDYYSGATIECTTNLERGVAIVLDDEATSGPGKTYRLIYPFGEVDPYTGFGLSATIPWNGNGVIEESHKMTEIEVDGAGTTSLDCTIKGTTGSYPVLGGGTLTLHSEESFGDGNIRYADAQVTGYHTTHLYLIIDWDFKYK